MKMMSSSIRVFFIQKRWRPSSGKTKSMPRSFASASRFINPRLRSAAVTAISDSKQMPRMQTGRRSASGATPGPPAAVPVAGSREKNHPQQRCSGPAAGQRRRSSIWSDIVMAAL